VRRAGRPRTCRGRGLQDRWSRPCRTWAVKDAGASGPGVRFRRFRPWPGGWFSSASTRGQPPRSDRPGQR
jgi:hypothetical protein